MAEQTAQSFGGLLRQLRTEARLTQAELADAAHLSPRSVSDLERGVNRTARKDTAEFLAEALGLDGATRLWNLNAQYAIERICAAAGGLTPRQWNQYIPQLEYQSSCAS